VLPNPRLFASNALACRIDNRELRGSVRDMAVEQSGGIRIRLRFERVPGSRFRIQSTVARDLRGGHREFVTVRNDRGEILLRRMLDAESGEVAVELGAGGGHAGAAVRFFALGVGHILGGFDHLLFLAGLLIGATSLREVVRMITAFTVAHSLTLGAASLGAVQMTSSIVEPLIAASIVYVGLENLIGVSPFRRWPLTFAFGLIHGFGFAGALRDLGLGTDGGIVVAVASFNLGVEAGQIAVAMVLLPLAWRLRAVPLLNPRLVPVCSLLIAAAGGYWLVERTLAALKG
jgi:hydrogenase/urease accessory protein HupE